MAQIAALVIKIPANAIIKKTTETLNVGIIYDYVGPPQTVYFTAVVTQETLIGEFDEIGSTKKIVYADVPGSDTPRSWITTVPSLPLSGVEPKATAYGVKVIAEGTFGTLEAGSKACLTIQAPVGISFEVSIWGVPDFGSYQQWSCSYWDPGISAFVGDGQWHVSSERITFSGVQSGGYLAVFLQRDSTVSEQYNSPAFDPVDGGVYQYDVEMGEVRKIG